MKQLIITLLSLISISVTTHAIQTAEQPESVDIINRWSVGEKVTYSMISQKYSTAYGSESPDMEENKSKVFSMQLVDSLKNGDLIFRFHEISNTDSLADAETMARDKLFESLGLDTFDIFVRTDTYGKFIDIDNYQTIIDAVNQNRDTLLGLFAAEAKKDNGDTTQITDEMMPRIFDTFFSKQGLITAINPELSLLTYYGYNLRINMEATTPTQTRTMFSDTEMLRGETSMEVQPYDPDDEDMADVFIVYSETIYDTDQLTDMVKRFYANLLDNPKIMTDIPTPDYTASLITDFTQIIDTGSGTTLLSEFSKQLALDNKVTTWVYRIIAEPEM